MSVSSHITGHEQLVRQIAFSHIKGINNTTGRHLLGLIGSVDSFFTMKASSLSSLTGLSERLTNDEYRQSLLADAEREAKFIESKNLTVDFFTDDNYSHRLLECEDAPTLIYRTGNCNLNCLHTVAIVGTRHATPYGIDFTRRLVTELATRIENLIIISGLAYGIDAAAHRASIDADIPTVAVMAHGLNTIYPADHRDLAANIVRHGGAIISEYDSASQIHRGNFLARNRIIAGLADVVIVVESDLKGGAMTTARAAMAYNRAVMAVPGRISDTYSRGTNQLIAEQTAYVLRSADDLIAMTGWTEKPQAGQQAQIQFELSPEESVLIDHIRNHPDHTINDISTGLGISLGQLSSILFGLEMRDIITAVPGGRYAITAPLD